jgi:hypothetical protein
MPRRRVIRRNPRLRTYAKRTAVSFSVPKARGKGKRRITFRAPRGVEKGETYTVMAKNRRRKVTRRRRTGAKRRVISNKRRATVRRRRTVRRVARKAAPKRRRVTRNKRRVVRAKRAPARRRKRRVAKRRIVRNRRRPAARRRRVSRRRVVRNRRRPAARKRKATRSRRRVRRNASAVKNRRRVTRRRKTTRRAAPRRRTIRRNRRRSSGRKRLFRRNGEIMGWVQTGGMIAAGVIGHKFLTGFLKNILVAKAPTAEALPNVDAQTDGVAPASGLGFLPASMVPYAGIISGAIAAAGGVYLVTKTVKNADTRKLVAGGMVASFLHTLIVDLLKKQAPGFAQQVSGLGASDANAARLSAMYGMGASIEPMYAPIGEYFSSGVSGLGLPSYEAQAGMGEYFASGVGEYFSSGVNGLGEYGANPDMMQAAAGYGAVDVSEHTNHLDPSSNLDRALSIAEAAAGVGSLGPMQAAAGLGNVHTVGASQTWIPGESDPQIWAGVRPVDRSQMATAMIPAGSLQSGGGQGIFG